MRIYLAAAAFAILSCFSSSCTSARECSRENTYSIEYFTGGGFTGMEQGLTVECSGWVKFWQRNLNSAKEQTDSLLLKSADRKIFDESMADTSLFRYSHKQPANYTATLVLRTTERSTLIMYPSSEVPADLPPAARRILSAIHNIHH